MNAEIHSGELLAFGDLHFSDVFRGKHKDYLTNCCGVLNQIKGVVERRKPSGVVFLGDLVGWNETNVRSREVLSFFLTFWKGLNAVCPVYTVRGNHDMKGYPDYNILLSLGLIREVDFLDYCGDVRFHFVGYGSESKRLEIREDGANIVFGHNNYKIDGVTTWYSEHDGVELNTLQNYNQVDMVVSGHIHEPSPEMVGVQMPSGRQCNLFYLGCPTRPIKQAEYNSCWYMVFKNDGVDTTFEVEELHLTPWSELFFDDEEIIEEMTDEEVQASIRKEKLAEVLQDIIQYRVLGGDIMSQLDRIPNASPEAVEMAKRYLRIAMGGEK